jgi:predicted translin family RNA/ssDNA-binding protein
MSISSSSKDLVPLGQVRAQLTELAEEVHAGSEKTITQIHLTLLTEAEQGLDDVDAKRTTSVAALRAKYGR